MNLPEPTTALQVVAVRVWESAIGQRPGVMISLAGLAAADQLALITFQRSLARWRLETVWS